MSYESAPVKLGAHMHSIAFVQSLAVAKSFGYRPNLSDCCRLAISDAKVEETSIIKNKLSVFGVVGM